MALAYLPTDTDGEPCRFTNHYRCDACEVEWSDQWSCACDDECPECGADISPHDYDEESDDEDERDHVACHACGRVEHIDLLDAKPDEPDNPAGCDWNRLECIACYGPGWCPATVPDAFARSIRDDLHGLYRGWRIMERLRDWRGDARSFLRRLVRKVAGWVHA
jgi:hypothetical protein